MREAAGVLVDQLLQCAVRDGEVWSWPDVAYRAHPAPTRLAWCYGTPGVAAALAAAAEAFDDEAARDAALRGARFVMEAPRSAWLARDHAICHGIAGVALCLGSIGPITERRDILIFADELLDEIASDFRPEAHLGYLSEFNREFVEDDGLLTGTSGIALALVSREATFDRRLLWFLGVR